MFLAVLPPPVRLWCSVITLAGIGVFVRAHEYKQNRDPPVKSLPHIGMGDLTILGPDRSETRPRSASDVANSMAMLIGQITLP